MRSSSIHSIASRCRLGVLRASAMRAERDHAYLMAILGGTEALKRAEETGFRNVGERHAYLMAILGGTDAGKVG